MRSFLLLLLAAMALNVGVARATAGECVAVALVVAIDGSGSVTDAEYAFQRNALAEALRAPDVVSEMNALGPVAVSVVFWGSAYQPMQEAPWVIIRQPSDATALALVVERAPRTVGGDTGLGAAMARSLKKLHELGVCAVRQIVNVSGDGRNSSPGPRQRAPEVPSAVRRIALQRGVTINALAMSHEERDLADYYASNVIAGPGAFVMEIDSYSKFAAAMRRKLIREIAPPQISDRGMFAIAQDRSR